MHNKKTYIVKSAYFHAVISEYEDPDYTVCYIFKGHEPSPDVESKIWTTTHKGKATEAFYKAYESLFGKDLLKLHAEELAFKINEAVNKLADEK